MGVSMRRLTRVTQSQRVRKRHAIAQGAFRGALNHLAVGHWIAEWNSKLDNVGACAGQFDE